MFNTTTVVHNYNPTCGCTICNEIKNAHTERLDNDRLLKQMNLDKFNEAFDNIFGKKHDTA